jgi:hypothetical protein
VPKADFDDGEAYFQMHGRRLEILPRAEGERPAPEFIEWHNSKVFRA